MNYVLITGSCGLVGSESVKFFIKKKFKIIGIDNNLRSYFFGKNASTSWIKSKLISSYKNNYKHFKSSFRRLFLHFYHCWVLWLTDHQMMF